jgi:methionyl-tRNA formyltransferase
MRVVFAGTPEFARRALAAIAEAGHDIPLVLTQPDRPAGRGMRPSVSAVKREAMSRAIDVLQPPTLKDPEVMRRLTDAQPDALVVAAYGLILPQAVLDLPALGAMNIHASLLPRWRGAAPIQRALLAGDRETGITIMAMDAGLDTGAMLAQRAVAIGADDDAGTLEDTLASLGAAMIVEALAEAAASTLRATPQPDEGATYAHKIDKRETVIDWARPAEEIERLLRAFRPAPGARSSLRGEAVKIWRARPDAARGEPGEVLAAGPDAIVVACGSGALGITELQRAGGRRMAVAEFLRGVPVAAHERFSA